MVDMKIYVIRHGETNANREGVLQGISDWPLNEDGIKLAEITGKNMKGIKFDACFSSPLVRAKQTAKLVLENSDNKNVDIQIDDRLIEMNMGIYEGKSIKPDNLEVPVVKILLYKLNPFISGRFKNGESAGECCKRTQNFLYELAKKDYECVLVSTHGGALRAMLHKLYKNRLSYWQGIVPLNCSVSIIDVKDNKLTLLEMDKTYYPDEYKIDRYKL